MGKHNPNGRYDAAEAEYIKMSSGGRFDAAYSVFLARELEHVRAQVLQVPKAPMNAFTVFPVATDVPPGAASAVQRVYDAVGMAKVISNYADDLPRVDIAGAEQSVKVVTLGDSYGYNVTEIENARFAGMNLDVWKAMAARRGIDQRINSIAWKGDKEHGITGFLNHPNITTVTLPADGANNSTTLASKSADEIIRDINALINAISTATNSVERANTVLLPVAAYDYLVGTPRSQYSDITILDFLRKAHPEVRFVKVAELTKASDDGKDMMIAGRFDSDVIRLEIPERFRQLPVEKRNLEYVVDCVSRVIGVTVIVPLAFSRAVGA